MPGMMRFAPYARRQETFASYYLKGMVAARHGKAFFTTTGAAQVNAVREALAPAPDLIFAFQLPAMLPLLIVRPAAPVFFDLDDLVHRVHRRAATTPPLGLGKAAQLLQVPAIFATEHNAIRLAARTSVCAKADARFLARFGVGNRVVVVPNAVACPVQAPTIPAEPTLLFLGKYNYGPNVLAAERLVRRIWPIVQRARPNARLLLAGGSIEQLPSASNPPVGVDYLGFIPDLDALYARTRVVCCPLDIAGGTRLKLIEAAAYARPMVSTRIGAEGLAFREETEILIRDDDAGFAAACIELLTDDIRCGQLGNAARKRMRECYEFSTVRDSIIALVGDAVAGIDEQRAI
jgi:glycosyltransferase involved in cell wall biosynthesis